MHGQQNINIYIYIYIYIDVLLTVHINIILVINQINAQILVYIKFITCLYMFRAISLVMWRCQSISDLITSNKILHFERSACTFILSRKPHYKKKNPSHSHKPHVLLPTGGLTPSIHFSLNHRATAIPIIHRTCIRFLLFYVAYLDCSAIVDAFRLIGTDEALRANGGISWCSSLTIKQARCDINICWCTLQLMNRSSQVMLNLLRQPTAIPWGLQEPQFFFR